MERKVLELSPEIILQMEGFYRNYKRQKYSPGNGIRRGRRGGRSRYARQHRRYQQRPFVRGFDRRGGFYGRYAGSKGGGVELKFKDTSFVGTFLSLGQVESMGPIAEGNGESGRIGRKITIRKIGFRLAISMASTATATETDDVCRVIIIQDKQANGAKPIVDDVLESTDFLSFNNLANSSRFKVLMDRFYDINAATSIGATATGQLTIHDSWFKECMIPIEYDGTDGSISTVRSNNIVILLIGFRQNATYTVELRVRYSDS